MRAMLAFCLSLFLAGWATAATFHVPADYFDIQTGLDAAAVGDTVLVACGTYDDMGIELKSGVTLRSETGASNCVTLAVANLGRILSGTDLAESTRIEGFTFLQGRGHGGALNLSNSSPTISDCLFDMNSSPNTGAAVACEAGSNPTFNGCDFKDNVGGAIYCQGSSPIFLDCEFLSNTAFSIAGAVLCDESSPSFEDCVFDDNSSTGAGGALACIGASAPNLNGCTFTSNATQRSGGAIYCEGVSAPVLNECDFTNNTAESRGGGLDIAGEASASVSNCDFMNNDCRFSGGAINIADDLSASFVGCSFMGNSADSYGGAIFCDTASTPIIQDCTFNLNTSHQGGGIYSNAAAIAQLAACQFMSNTTSGNGAGLYIYDNDIDFVDCRFFNNQNQASGGGVYSVISSPSFQNCSFENNGSRVRGAAVFQLYEGSAPARFASCTFEENAAHDGAALFLFAGDAELDSCLFTDNEATWGGGGVYSASASNWVARNCTFAENIGQVAGAGIFCDVNSSATMENSIIAFNRMTEGLFGRADASVTLTRCDIFGNDGGDWVGGIADQLGQDGNFSADPQFCGTAGDGAYNIATDSPCAPDNNGGILIGALPAGCDRMVVVESTTWSSLKSMY